MRGGGTPDPRRCPPAADGGRLSAPSLVGPDPGRRGATLALLASLTLGAACTEDALPVSADLRLDRAEVHFGRVPLGDVATASVDLLNAGDEEGRIVSVLGASGGLSVTTGAAPIPPGATVPVIARFEPRDGHPAAAEVRLELDSGTPLELSLTGIGYAPDIRVAPSRIDFNPTVIDSRRRRTLYLTHHGEPARTVSIEPGAGTAECGANRTGDSFCVEGDLELRLAAGARAEVPIVYAPRDPTDEPGRHRGQLLVRTCPDCTQIVPLAGTSLPYGVTCAATLDFGDVNPGSCVSAELACENAGNRTVALLGASATDAFVAPAERPMIAPGARAALPVRFCPEAPGSAEGRLTLELDQRAPGAQLVVELTGRGGGPDLRVAPDGFDLGTTAALVPIRREVHLENVGDRTLTVLGISAEGDALVEAEGTRHVAHGQGRTVAVHITPTRAGEWQGALRIETDDRDGPVRLPLRGRALELPPCRYDTTTQISVGTVAHFFPSVAELWFENRGTSDCLITDFALSTTPPTMVRLPHPPARPLRVAGGDRISIPLEVYASGPTTIQGEVELQVSDPVRPRVVVPIVGESAASGLTTSPARVDFGVLAASCTSQTREVRLHRHRRVETHLVGLSVSGDGFSLVGGPDLSTGPSSLELGQQIDVQVGFRPVAGRTSVGALTVDLLEDEVPVRQTVALVGRGEATPVAEERFVQLGRAAVDMLFVVDFSGCMGQEQVGLGSSLPGLMRVIDVEQLNYQIGVTTTDLDDEGGRLMHPDRERGNPFGGPFDQRIIHPGTPNRDEVFRRSMNARNLTGGSARDESPLGAAYYALQPNLLNGHNLGFLRPDAHLTVFFMTDEPEQTMQQMGPPTDRLDFYLDYFRGLKGVDGRRAFTALPIAGDPMTGCVGDGGAASANPRLAEFAARNDDPFSSICVPDWDWAGLADDLAGPAAGERTSFILGQAATIGTIEVRFDGVLVPPAAASAPGWTYRPADHALIFDSTATPEPGVELTVTYVPACP